jgi:hypothetical protein
MPVATSKSDGMSHDIPSFLALLRKLGFVVGRNRRDLVDTGTNYYPVN